MHVGPSGESHEVLSHADRCVLVVRDTSVLEPATA
jgi:hypothetical protein